MRSAFVRLAAALPGSRLASDATTGDQAFLSADHHTEYALVFPRPDRSGQLSARAIDAARRAVAGTLIAGAPVHVTGLDALRTAGAGGKGTGVMLQALIGAAGALVVLAFVFGSFIAIVPLITAAVAIMSTLLVIRGLAAVTTVSTIVQYLIALSGLGVAIDYSLLIIVGWREEAARGADREQAVVAAMATAGRAVTFSGLTVAVGLLALVVLPVSFMRSVGAAGMLIPLISVAVALTLLPVILATDSTLHSSPGASWYSTLRWTATGSPSCGISSAKLRSIASSPSLNALSSRSSASHAIPS